MSSKAHPALIKLWVPVTLTVGKNAKKSLCSLMSIFCIVYLDSSIHLPDNYLCCISGSWGESFQKHCSFQLNFLPMGKLLALWKLFSLVILWRYLRWAQKLPWVGNKEMNGQVFNGWRMATFCWMQVILSGVLIGSKIQITNPTSNMGGNLKETHMCRKNVKD